ncbi:MAG: diguanylate cyclase [Terracidiphilus sp.]|jgi:diguanylate cyclase (GGDEF)-like protein/PAS domain S-box-containing protein
MVMLAVVFVDVFERNGMGGDLIWVANGAILAYLLLAPRWLWPAYLLTSFLALVFGSMLIHETWQISLQYNLLDLGEVLLAALLVRRRTTQLPRFTEFAYLLRFIGFAVLAAPMATGLTYTWLSRSWTNVSPLYSFLRWAGADGLGIAVITPICVAIFQSALRGRKQVRQHWLYLALTAALAIVAFSQNKVPLVFLIYPLLVYLSLSVDLGSAALALLEVTAVGSWFTIRGEGPFHALGFVNPIGPNVLLQLFIIAGIFILFSISVVLERQKATERKLQEIVSLHRLVTENSRDVIIVADFDGNRSYVSSASKSMGGWNSEEAMELSGLQLVHPEDRNKAGAAMRDLRSGRDDALVECRVRKANGEYLWVEAALRLIRDPSTGLPSGILNTVRDISERKRSEQQLREAYHAVETLALTDGLTGLANRRRFDQYMASEWRRSMRNCQPLSLLMLDVDLFKLYNDTYGHQRGDNCLKQIAEACMDIVSRPGDLVARFGGEEFVVVLPNTEIEGALQVANEICESLRSRRLPHTGSPFGIITISIGYAALIPTAGRYASDLIAMADHALYTAKHNGRNQVCLGCATERHREHTSTSTLS